MPTPPNSLSRVQSVGIAIPTYNPRPEHLIALLDSLWKQSQPASEVVVFDDRSDRVDVEELVAAYSERLPVRFHQQPSNQGMVANWNSAVGAITSDAIVLMGQDDLLLPSFLERTMHRLAGAVAVSVATDFIDDDGEALRPGLHFNHRSRIFRPGNDYILPPDNALVLALKHGNVLGEPSGVLYRRSALEVLGFYDNALPHAADLDFHLRLAMMGPFVYVGDPLTCRRRHANALSVRHMADGTALRDRHKLFERYGRGLPAPSRQEVRVGMAARDAHDALRALAAGNWVRAGEAVLAAVAGATSLRPSTLLAYRHEARNGVNVDGLRTESATC